MHLAESHCGACQQLQQHLSCLGCFQSARVLTLVELVSSPHRSCCPTALEWPFKMDFDPSLRPFRSHNVPVHVGNLEVTGPSSFVPCWNLHWNLSSSLQIGLLSASANRHVQAWRGPVADASSNVSFSFQRKLCRCSLYCHACTGLVICTQCKQMMASQ